MFRYGTLNAVGDRASPDAGPRAVSISPHGPGGLWVVAGTLPATFNPETDLAGLHGNFYEESQRISFARWADVLDYFAGTDLEPLIRQIADRIALYPDVKYPA